MSEHIHRAGVVCECGVDIDEEIAYLQAALTEAHERIVDLDANRRANLELADHHRDTLQRRVEALVQFIRKVLRSGMMAHLSSPLREEARILLGEAALRGGENISHGAG